jgi:hypothetical protein
MRFTNIAFTTKIWGVLLAMLATVTLVYAEQRPQQSQREESSARSEPSRAPEQRSPVTVDRVNHGSIRHVDTQVVQRPVEVQRSVEVHHPVEVQRRAPNYGTVIRHTDPHVDIGRTQFWHGFVFGSRIHGLRSGYIRLLLNGLPYFYDSGIYYQQVGDYYQEVYPPVGAFVQELPPGAIQIDVGNIIYYYACGAFYVQQDGGFVIVPTPIGITVPELPPGAVQVAANGGVAYQFNGIYYQPVFVNGVTQFTTFVP